jgi:hypothetical protein
LSGTATITSGLAAGAESSPRGVGGPRLAPESTPRVAEAAPVAISGATPPRLTKSAAAQIAPHPGTWRRREPAVGAADPSAADGAHRQPLAQLPGVGEAERWCHAVGSDQASTDDATPELVRIARLASGGAEPASAPKACLAAEPPLQNMARAGIDLITVPAHRR